MVLNAEYFLAMKVLLDEPGTPQPSKPQWPDELLAGDYVCHPERCGIPNWQQVSLWQRADYILLTADNASGFVQRTIRTERNGVAWWQWEIVWDNLTGALSQDTLWLQVHDAQHFDLYDAQGRCNAYALLAEEEIPQRALWPEPLYMAVYQVEAADAALIPPFLHTLEFLEYDDEPLLQSASMGICSFQETYWDDDGCYHATLAWSLRDDAGDVQPPDRIQLQIQDGDHFVWIQPDGSRVRYTWSRDI